MRFWWYERNRRRDPDNVAAGGRKLVLDGLVSAGVLEGDGWHHIRSWEDQWFVNPEKPGVFVSMSTKPKTSQVPGSDL